jgi:hypothetical protein
MGEHLILPLSSSPYLSTVPSSSAGSLSELNFFYGLRQRRASAPIYSFKPSHRGNPIMIRKGFPSDGCLTLTTPYNLTERWTLGSQNPYRALARFGSWVTPPSFDFPPRSLVRSFFSIARCPPIFLTIEYYIDNLSRDLYLPFAFPVNSAPHNNIHNPIYKIKLAHPFFLPKKKVKNLQPQPWPPPPTSPHPPTPHPSPSKPNL